jgi:general nucleoside transport system ATP-binding protein
MLPSRTLAPDRADAEERELEPPVIELRAIDKWFGPVHANCAVSLSLARGSITGIVGENGAGKTTLMNILYGLYQADSGEILRNGRSVRISSPRHALANGIGMVHQHFMLVDTFSVLENIVLGAETGPVLRDSLTAARRELDRLGSTYGLRLDADARVADLPVGEQQRVEIVKVLFRGAQILILDEPTGVLTPQETDQLFHILKTLRARGVTIILITHKLREIVAVTDCVYVMRQGRIVAHRRTGDTTHEELAELMVGRKVRLALDKDPPQIGAPVLVAKDIGLKDDRGVDLLASIDLTLRAGEIVGIAGVSGNGQTELLEVLAGIRPPTVGSITMGQRDITAVHHANPAEMRQLGLAHVPEDRLRFGMVAAFAAAETSILGYHRKAPFSEHGLLNRRAIVQHCLDLMQRFDVRPRRPAERCANFSGGNQQKLILARELTQCPRVLLVGQPTRGVDIGAIEFIHRQLIAMRDAGCAILLVSVELEEVMSLADRIMVMFAGRIVGEVLGSMADERILGRMMANVWTGSAELAGGAGAAIP